MKNIIPPILVLIIFLLVWTFVAHLYNMSFLLPNPLEVFEAFIQDIDLIITRLWITFQDAFYGYLTAIIIGITRRSIHNSDSTISNGIYDKIYLIKFQMKIPSVKKKLVNG